MKSIVVPTHKHLEDCLKPCCASIVKNTDLSDVEVIIVANGCGDDGTREYVESLGAPFKLVWVDEGLGYTKAMNIGLAMAQGDVLIPMNNDCVILDFQAKNVWLDRLLDPLKDPTVGITGPLKIRDAVTGYDFLVFFLVAFSRELYEKLGPLDEIYNPGAYEDVDWCLRAEQLGYKTVMVANQQGVDEKRGWTITDYPCFHSGEATVMDAEHIARWEAIKAKNAQVLRERYPRLPEGMFYEKDVIEYRKLAREVPDGGTICELGTWKGRSLCAIADLIKSKGLKVVAVDTFEGTVNEPAMVQLAKQDDPFSAFLTNMKRFGLHPLVRKMTTDEAAELVEDGSLDLCFVDADHSYAGVMNDLTRWIPKVKKGGVIGGHDYNGTSWPGVRRAVDERFRDIHFDGQSLVWSRQL